MAITIITGGGTTIIEATKKRPERTPGVSASRPPEAGLFLGAQGQPGQHAMAGAAITIKVVSDVKSSFISSPSGQQMVDLSPS